MTLVDANILVYAVDHRSPFHEPCKRWLEAPRSMEEGLCTSWPIVYEFLRVMTHPRVFTPPLSAAKVFSIVERIVRSPGFKILTATAEHVVIAKQVIDEIPRASGNLMHDLHTVVLMREHGILRIATNDKDFAHFRGIEVINPAAA